MYRLYVCMYIVFRLWEGLCAVLVFGCLVVGGWFVLMEGWQVNHFVQLLGMGQRGG